MLQQLLSEYRLCLAELESSAAMENFEVQADAIGEVKQALLEREQNEDEKLHAEMISSTVFDSDPVMATLRIDLTASI
jgi:hypothetical protein